MLLQWVDGRGRSVATQDCGRLFCSFGVSFKIVTPLMHEDNEMTM